ncbi:MAG TPA: transglycosylase domain-containing protein, partial [Salinimicrobium sp.]|nr:transglycosylase domain-containing protein [Salinimicrobium sp.]
MGRKTATSKKDQKKKSEYSRYIIWFWSLFAGGILLAVLIFLLAGWGVFGPMPTFEELENPETNLATEIFSADGETLGKYYNENRTPVTYDEIPQNLVNAIVATEDERYYDHAGIDPIGTMRAIFYLGSKGGASTITQQLAKMLFTENVSGNTFERIIQKIKEWVIATRLERQYTKNEIITMYLNKYDFIYQAVGIRSAAKIYFGKEPIDLKVEESAVLTAMLKNPSYFNPIKDEFKDNALRRRNVVLGQMAKNDYITTEERDSLQQLPLVTNYTPQGHDEGIATYFRAYLRGFLKDWIDNNPKPNGEEYSLYRDGLKIYTTIDSRMQQYAEEAVAMHLENLQEVFNEKNENNPTAPFRDITKEEREDIIRNAMKRSVRWRQMEAKGASTDEIVASFKKETEMSVFSWDGIIDTVMT